MGRREIRYTYFYVGLHNVFILMYSTDLLYVRYGSFFVLFGSEVSIRQSILNWMCLILNYYTISCISAGALRIVSISKLFLFATSTRFNIYITKKISFGLIRRLREIAGEIRGKFDFAWFFFPKRNANSRAMDTMSDSVVNSAVYPTSN